MQIGLLKGTLKIPFNCMACFGFAFFYIMVE